MGSESDEAETRAFNFLHLLAFAHRNDAEDIINKNKPPEDLTPNKKVSAMNKVRGASFMEKDLKTRKKENIRVVFALSDLEFK